MRKDNTPIVKQNCNVIFVCHLKTELSGYMSGRYLPKNICRLGHGKYFTFFYDSIGILSVFVHCSVRCSMLNPILC